MASVRGDGAAASPSLWQQIWRRKPVAAMTDETGADTGEGELARTIGLFQLSLFGIGATIGTGIFIVLTVAVPEAGPAVIWSFVMAGVVAGLTAICYAELASAVPVSWPPSAARVDAESRAHLGDMATEALEQARARLPQDIPVTTVVHHARSTPAGLLEVAEQRGASIVVAGSSAGGGTGQVTLGSATGRLLHSSPIPVALAPRGFRVRPDARVTRVTAAFGGSEDELVVAAAGVAARVGATLRLASFAVRARAPYTVAAAREADNALLAEWIQEIHASQRAVLDRVHDLPSVPDDCDAVVGRGENWEDALEDIEWDDGDVLVVGSSSIGPIARVFLGSRATKIVRNSPVPVVVVPRSAAAELAEAAAADAQA